MKFILLFALLAISARADSLTLTWTDNSSDEDGFKLERSDDGGVTWGLIVNTNKDVVSYVDTTVTLTSDYQYRVSAFTFLGQVSDLSAVAKWVGLKPPTPTPTPAAPKPLAKPTNLKVKQ